MASEHEFLLPKFAHEGWGRVGVPAAPGELRTVSSSDTALRNRLFDPLDSRCLVLSREAKPTMWAQAEVFRERLREHVDVKRKDWDAVDFQVWGGMLAALFQTDLIETPLESSDVIALDEDLYPALKASLPITPTQGNWPEVLYRMHRNDRISLIQTRKGGAVVAACYAPCLLFPALQMPTPAQDPALEKFRPQEGEPAGHGHPLFELRFLMERYTKQNGFADGLYSVLEWLAREIEAAKSTHEFSDLVSALRLVQDYLASEWGAKAIETIPEGRKAPWAESTSSFLQYRYQNPVDFVEGTGKSGYWEVYPLKGRAPDGRTTILFIAEGVDLALNPWAAEPAFPTTRDVHNRLCDLSIRHDKEQGIWEVLGLNDTIYQVPEDHHVVSLHPQAPPELKIVMDSLLYLEGEGNAVKENLLDPIHKEWRRTLSNRTDLTTLVPLHVNLLRFFPEFIKAPTGLVSILSGSAGESNSAEARCQLRLPLGPGRAYEYVWRTRLIGWKLEETRLPESDIWPSFRSAAGGDTLTWSAYFIRTKSSTGRLRVVYHGEKEIRTSSDVGTTASAGLPQLYSFEVLTSPPRIAEVVQAGGKSFGLLFLSREVYSPVYPGRTPRWEVAVDFGTSNTSVALRAGKDAPPQTLEYSAWGAPLLYSIAADEKAPDVHPGWFLRQGNGSNFYRGFFPTLLGYDQRILNDKDLLKMLEEPTAQEGYHLGSLIGSIDLLGIKAPGLARQISTLGESLGWGVEDDLKWGSDGASPETETRRKAFRTAFLELLLLLVCAESYGRTGALPERYTFTFPLSMKLTDRNQFQATAGRAARVVQSLIDSRLKAPPEVRFVNESQAAFRAFLKSKEVENLRANKRVVLIDMGGGSSDYAVFAGGSQGGSSLCFLDSMVLAGNRFFEFLPDIGSEAEHNILREGLKELFKDHLVAPSEKDLRSEEKVRNFRQFHNALVSAMMPEKNPYVYADKDLTVLRQKERVVAAQLESQADRYPPAHWMRSLFSTVVIHGLMLGLAPVQGNPTPEYLDLVVAGNGWGLLHHAGIRRDKRALEIFVRDLYEKLLSFLATFHADNGELRIDRFPRPDRVYVVFMDDVIQHGTQGQGVYSKDIVAIGGVLEEGEDTEGGPKGIFGFDLKVVPVTNLGHGPGRGNGQAVQLPWHASIDREAVDALVIRQLPDLGEDKKPQWLSEKPKVVRLTPDPAMETPFEEGMFAATPQQLFALDLLKTHTYLGTPWLILSPDQWEEWNAALYKRVEMFLSIYGDAHQAEAHGRTSLIRNIWEYPFQRKTVRRELLDMMREKN
jgi:hypothetical protein